MVTIETKDGDLFDTETFVSVPISETDTLLDLFRRFAEEYKFPNIECTPHKVHMWKKERISKSTIDVKIFKSFPKSFELHILVNNSIGIFDMFTRHSEKHHEEIDKFLEREIDALSTGSISKQSVLNKIFS